MLADHWPTYALRIHTPRLCLRLPTDDELAALANLAAQGVHAPGEQPFLIPWTDGTPEQRAQTILRRHWAQLEGWQPARWQLGLGVFVGDVPVGMVSMWASDFSVVHEVGTASWLGLDHHGQGIGTEARAGLLAFAFEHLGATDAVTQVFPDNHASQAVSRKLGYRADGISRDARGKEVVVSHRLRLTAAEWAARDHVSVSVEGLDKARSFFMG